MNSYYEHYKKEVKRLSKEEPLTIELFEDEIKAICEKFSNQGHSGGSAQFYIGALSGAINSILSRKPLGPLNEEDIEWSEESIDDAFTSVQSTTLSSLFKDKVKVYYLDAIHFKDQNGTCFSTSSIEGISSSQYVEFPFTPKTFYIDVISTETKPDGWESKIKDHKQLEEVFEYYNKK